MALPPSDLLTDEQWLTSKPANAVIRLDDYGLSSFAFENYMALAGMQGKEAIGGHLELTTYRLVFHSHGFNRVTGKFSIFLPTIQAVRDTSHLFVKRMSVYTRTQQYDFIVWGIPAFIQAILAARDHLDPAMLPTLQNYAVTDYAKCGDGFQVQRTLEAINVGLLTTQKIKTGVSAATNPFELSSALNLLELFSGPESSSASGDGNKPKANPT